jgi:hypothetical protein
MDKAKKNIPTSEKHTNQLTKSGGHQKPKTQAEEQAIYKGLVGMSRRLQFEPRAANS